MLKLLKGVFGDILKIYINFFHFNLNKIISFVVSILYMLIIALPFLAIIWYFYYYIYNMGTLKVLEHYDLLIAFSLFVFIAFIIVFGAFTYYFPLILKVSNDYINGKKYALSKNNFFNLKFFFTYLKLYLLTIFIIFSPFIILFGFFFLAIYFYGGVSNINYLLDSDPRGTFVITSAIFMILAGIAFLYLAYKTIFAIVILVIKYDEEKKIKNAFYYIKKSFKKANGIKNFFLFISIFISIGIISFPFTFMRSYYFDNLKYQNDYIKLSKNEIIISKENIGYFNSLKKKYILLEPKSFNKLHFKTFILYILSEIVYFFLIVGLFETALISFYKRQLD